MRSRLAIGGLGEAANLLALLALNFAGPVLLGVNEYGIYASLVAPAMLCVGVIDRGISIRLLTGPLVTGRDLATQCLRNAAITGSSACLLVLVTMLSQGVLIVVAVTTLAAAYSLFNSARAFLLKAEAYAAYSILAVGMACLFTASLWIVHVGGQQGKHLLIAQGVSVGTVAGLACLLAVRYSRRESACQVEPTVGGPQIGARAPLLAMPTLYVSALQWPAILVLGITSGPVAAGFLKILFSVSGLPSTALPLSGELIHSVSSRHAANERYRPMILAVTAVGGAVSLGIWLFRYPVLAVLDIAPSGEVLWAFTIACVAGVGLVWLKMFWFQALSTIHRRWHWPVAAVFVCLASFPLPFALAGPFPTMLAAGFSMFITGLLVVCSLLVSGRRAGVIAAGVMA